MKKFHWIVILFLLTHCGGSESSGDGYLALQVEDARGPKGLAEPPSLSLEEAQGNSQLQVTQFKVTITGAGIDPSIISTADASATEIEVLGIPAGLDRTILIEAFNATGTVIRRREIMGVEVKAGVVSSLQTSLNTIPIVLNLQEGSVILADRFRIVGFGEPGSPLQLNTASSSQSFSLNPSESESPIVISPSLSSGLFDYTPTSPLKGRQTITLRDQSTGESSSITVYILNGADRPGRKLNTAGSLGPSVSIGLEMKGSPSGSFPKILQNLWSQTVGGKP